MRQKREAGNRARGGVATVAIIGVILILAGGCDPRVDVRGLKFELPTAPTSPTTPAGATVSEARAIAGVEAVSLAAVGLVEIRLGAAESLTITAPESVMPLLTSEVVGGRLILDRASPSYQGQATDIQYDVALRRLEELILEGVGEINAEGVDTGLFRVERSGVGSVRAGGRADRQEVRMSGLGDYLAPSLETRVTWVDMTGGDALIWATERIEGRVAIGCTLEYHGNPVVEVTGGGVVRKIGFGS